MTWTPSSSTRGPRDGGPFSQVAHRLAAARAADLARLAAGFDHLAGVTAPARADPAITDLFRGGTARLSLIVIYMFLESAPGGQE